MVMTHWGKKPHFIHTPNNKQHTNTRYKHSAEDIWFVSVTVLHSQFLSMYLCSEQEELMKICAAQEKIIRKFNLEILYTINTPNEY